MPSSLACPTQLDADQLTSRRAALRSFLDKNPLSPAVEQVPRPSPS
jgi:hypothetical protein